ncbi:MAG TPA: HlyD family efflux transporter periplasmic adaptor subunit [Thermoanaerobaculia bacterium]|nr:HlyD family efflux transporter periplasmic adaptor subunit [Thermoanaerobaculia bacterium]
MDIVRPSGSNTKKLRRIATGGAIILAVIVATVAFARLKPAAPSVDRASVIIDTVESGPFTRAIRAGGTLVPENIRWIAAATDARVERIVVQPGTAVQADTVLIELADPQQQQSASDASWQLRAAEAAYEAAQAELTNERLDREANAARLHAEYTQARLRAKADADLEKAGLAASITRELSQTTAEELARRVEIENRRVSAVATSQRARLATLQAQVEQARALNTLRRQQTESLLVRAGIDGVLQQVTVQAGQRIAAGTNLARVAEPSRLKAEVRVAELQAKDVTIGQAATIDTRNGIVKARVARIDPAVVNGTVVVDLTILDPLPAGARPDLTVDATIELDRVPQAIFVARPVAVQELGSGTLFRVEGNEARRVKVDFGRASAESIEIRGGLRPGDQVIVSDTTTYERFDRLELE